MTPATATQIFKHPRIQRERSVQAHGGEGVEGVVIRWYLGCPCVEACGVGDGCFEVVRWGLLEGLGVGGEFVDVVVGVVGEDVDDEGGGVECWGSDAGPGPVDDGGCVLGCDEDVVGAEVGVVKGGAGEVWAEVGVDVGAEFWGALVEGGYVGDEFGVVGVVFEVAVLLWGYFLLG